MRLAASFLIMSLCVGCRGTIHIEHNVAANSVQETSHDLVLLGLQSTVKDDAGLKKWQGYAGHAQEVIDSILVPLFKGDSLNDVTRSAADQALQVLGDKIDPKLRSILQLAVSGALVFVNLPDNPAQKLSESQRLMVLSVFQGMSAGITDFLKETTASGTRDLTPPLDQMTWSRHWSER